MINEKIIGSLGKYSRNVRVDGDNFRRNHEVILNIVHMTKNIPMMATKFKAGCEYSNIGEHLTTKNTPAVTIVAA